MFLLRLTLCVFLSLSYEYINLLFVLYSTDSRLVTLIDEL